MTRRLGVDEYERGEEGRVLRILLIEDDHELAAAMVMFLRGKQFVVERAATLAAATVALPLAIWDAVLLDLQLPDGDGITLLPLLRRRAPDAAVIVLTARDHISERIRGLDAGADDYLVKPFDPDELLARLRAIERRRSRGDSAVVVIGDLTVDLSRASVKVRDEGVTLTAKEWVVLRALVARADRVHSKEALASVLYGFDDEIGSNTVEVFISHLRQKLGRNSVLTLRGQGYRLTGDCT
jgi:two-component system, OmpR family, response regulator